MERLLSRIAPQWALRRQIARMQLSRLYDAAMPSDYRRTPRGAGRSGDAVMEHARTKITAWARHLDENHDLATGVLDDLVAKIIGTGIAIEPMPVTNGNKVNKRLAEQIREHLDVWWQAPEVGAELSMPEAQRISCRSWLRDGEVFLLHVEGNRYRSRSDNIPYRFELLESDYCPFDLLDTKSNVVHGVQKDSWRRPFAYHFYLQHPGDVSIANQSLRQSFQTKIVPAELVEHLKLVTRIGQTRGTSIFHSVITRLDDIKDYEESERIAARVNAVMVAFIRRSPDFTGQESVTSDGMARAFPMIPGTVWDNLMAGEEPGILDSKRPNTALLDFRKSQLKAIASGTGSTYSAIAKSYDGTYSSQRQELVESAASYDRMRSQFISDLLMPVYRRLVMNLASAQMLDLPGSVDINMLAHAEYRGPAVPWIDPLKEVEADIKAIENRLISRHQVIRRRGGDPQLVDQMIAQDIAMNSKPEQIKQAESPPPEEDEADEEFTA